MGWLRSGERPSMVVIFLPATAEMGVTQDRTGWPSMWTVQAPHNDMPHPNLVPVMPSVSRKTQSSGMAETASTDCGLPFKVNLTAGKGMTFPHSYLGSIKKKRMEWLFLAAALVI